MKRRFLLAIYALTICMGCSNNPSKDELEMAKLEAEKAKAEAEKAKAEADKAKAELGKQKSEPGKGNGNPTEKRFIQSARVQMQSLHSAIMAYYLAVGRRPEKLEDLIQAPKGMLPAKWRGPYVNQKDVPKDPWETEYQLNYGSVPKNTRAIVIELRSAGPNKIFNDSDDIVSN